MGLGPPYGTGWLDRFTAFCDDLGIHDRDYERAQAMIPIVKKGLEVRAQNSNSPDQGYYALAGYYNSLGPEWATWSVEARKIGEYAISERDKSQ